MFDLQRVIRIILNGLLYSGVFIYYTSDVQILPKKNDIYGDDMG